MSWYGNYNESSRQLDALLETKPSLSVLLLSPDFAEQLKSFNPKLMEYISNSSSIPNEIVTYISVPPSEQDSVDRKYKLPLLTIEMMETENVNIFNTLLKNNNQGVPYILQMFDMLKSTEVLPLLAGYFYRANLAICRSKYREILELVFSSKIYLELLIQHSYMMTISDCLTLFLCVESSKNITFPEDKSELKISIVKSIFTKIEKEYLSNDEKSQCTVYNLCLVLRELVERYYLNSYGKQLLEIVLEENNVEIVINMMRQKNENSFPAMLLILSILKYYSLSAFNSEEGNEEMARKNMERLEAQPFVRIIDGCFKSLLDQIKKEEKITLYSYHVLEVLCHCVTLSSNKILARIKETELFPTLIDLLFKNEKCNILHKLIERTLSHIFITEKNIYEKYKEYLFIDISIIDLTAKRLLEMFPDPSPLPKVQKKCYFGVLMKIIKIYSSILTVNEKIREAISSRTELWREMSKKILKPYEESHKEEMGNFENVPDTVPVEFKVKKIENDLMPRLIQNASALEEVKREEETMPKTLELSENKNIQSNHTMSETKIEEDSFFSPPLEELGKKKSSDGQIQSEKNTKLDNSGDNSAKEQERRSSLEKNTEKEENENDECQGPQKSLSFKEFLSKEKVKVGEEIKMQRSLSGEKRLSADKKKTRLASPSPKRKANSWKEEEPNPTEKTEKNEVKSKPKIPLNRLPVPNSMTKSCVEPEKKALTPDVDNKIMMSLSMMELETLKKITIGRQKETPPDGARKYRKPQNRDKALFMYLGVKF